MIFEWDDFGVNHIISDQCQSHDCRDQLDKLHLLNPAFKATLFTIPGEMTPELYNWCAANSSWIELAWHGFFHTSNYECEKMSYEEFDTLINGFSSVGFSYQNIFRAPGWQISDAVIEWLFDHDWIIADQSYNDRRRPENMKAYVNREGIFSIQDKSKTGLGDFNEEVEAYHGHTWDVGWNGIYEDYAKVEQLVKDTKEFKFISELFI